MTIWLSPPYNSEAVSLQFASLFLLEHILGGKIKQALQTTRQKHFPLIPSGFTLDREVCQVTSAAEARRAFSGSRAPLVWKGGAKNSRVARWNLKHLQAKAGSTPVKILSLAGLDNENAAHANEVMQLAQFIRLLPKGDTYLRFSDLLDNAPQLRDELPLELLRDLGHNPRRVNLQFFLGPADSRTPLHSELNCNIFIQVFGRKRWVIFPVEATEELQPPSAGRFYFFSPLDPLTPKKDQRIRESKALSGWEIILEPGDILLSPPLLWHAVENLTTSCAVGYKFNRLDLAFRASPLLFCMNLLARNPSYFSYIWSAFVRRRHPILATK